MSKTCARTVYFLHLPSIAGKLHFLQAKISDLEREKNTVHSMMKIPNSMLPTSCLTFATRMRKKEKNSLSREHYFSTQLMHEVDTHPVRVLRVACWAFVGPVSASCSCCILLVQPVANLLCFFLVISVIQWSICTLGF